MQLQHLRYFVAVADTRHFTQAAEAVGVTQPSLSKQIHALEAELRAPLFDRRPGAVTLTSAGETLLPLARRILADVETAHREVQHLIGLRRGRLRLGATPSLCTSLVAPILRRYRAAHPEIELFVAENGSRDLVNDLIRGELDIAMIVSPHDRSSAALHTEPLLRERLVVASAADLSPPWPERMTAADLQHHPLVMFRPGYDLREATLALCRSEGAVPRFVVEGGEMDAVLAFVEAGIGGAVVPSMVLTGRPGLRASALEAPGAHRLIALAHRRDTAVTHAAQALRRAVLDHLADGSQRGDLPAGVSLHPGIAE